ncbi:MAG: division/cell wall cluster transcriptional repressor MraZ [Saprospiraceae bacterium]|nr:division/cell wall cluster transcriptional repressor MraZ [Saprospiraceae bacterium]
MQLIGEYPVALDEKGRLRLPTALLRQLPALTGAANGEGAAYEFVVNRGFEKCLTLYPKPVWDGIAARLSRLNSFNDRHRAFVRAFHYGAYPLTTDSADRILLQKPLMDYAGITREAILLAMNDKIEIWSAEHYASTAAFDPGQFADLANDVMGGDEM